jgi:phosphoserine phosphatase RsbU/P
MLAMTTGYLLEAQRVLTEKNREISEINRSVFESIGFAEVIQSSLLPDVQVLRSKVADADYRVLNQVGIGGDTVFVKDFPNAVLFGLFDATGHGVPAAMLSISGQLMLSELVSGGILQPEMAIHQLNLRLSGTFNRSLSLAHMEGIACLYEPENNTLTYCSARGKAICIPAAGEVKDLSYDKVSIGEDPSAQYWSHSAKCSPGDKLLLYSDGLTDQFGGDRDKKYSRRRLKAFLSQNRNLAAGALCEALHATHDEWKESTAQTDDVSFLIAEF